MSYEQKKWKASRARIKVAKAKKIKARLEYLRGELRAERISYGELSELQSLAEHIDKGDVELLEPAGVPEFPEPSKYESTKQKGLFYWAEKIELDERLWGVVSQVEGYPATEAHDDWFAHQKDADECAQLLAKGGE